MLLYLCGSLLLYCPVEDLFRELVAPEKSCCDECSLGILRLAVVLRKLVVDESTIAQILSDMTHWEDLSSGLQCTRIMNGMR